MLTSPPALYSCFVHQLLVLGAAPAMNVKALKARLEILECWLWAFQQYLEGSKLPVDIFVRDCPMRGNVMVYVVQEEETVRSSGIEKLLTCGQGFLEVVDECLVV
jgi:hypothetical protein